MAEKIEKAPDNGSHEKYKHPVLTDMEVEAARASAKTKALAAQKKKAKERLEEEEMQRLVVEEGLTEGGPLDEMVEITLNLAVNQPYLSTNGFKFMHGGTYKVRRSVANDLLYRQDQGHKAEAARLGVDSFAFYQQKKAPVIRHINGKVT